MFYICSILNQVFKLNHIKFEHLCFIRSSKKCLNPIETMNATMPVKNIFTGLFLLLFSFSGNSQIIIGNDTLYGNEWINFDSPERYFKIPVAEDGIYRISKSALPGEASSVKGNQFQLWHNGAEVPVYVSSEDDLSNSDYIEFYGTRNRMEVDQHFFSNKDDIFNPEASLITDTSAYFLTWNDTGNNNRFATQQNDLSNPPPPETFFHHKSIQHFYESHNKFANGSSIQQSYFDKGQGFGRLSTAGSRQNIFFRPEAVSTEATDAEFEYWAIAYSNTQHAQQLKLNNQVIEIDSFFGYDLRKRTVQLSTDDFRVSNKFEIRGLVSGQDKQILAFASLTYPRSYDFGDTTSFQFTLPASNDAKYLEISNFDVTGNPVLYDITNNFRIEATEDGGLIKILLPPSATERKLILINNDSGVIPITGMRNIKFIDYRSTNPEFIILTSQQLNESGTGIENYSNYRSRDFRTLVVEIEQLYEQFIYGLNRNALGIKNFANFIKKNNPDLKYLLILGKGREYADIRTPEKLTGGGLSIPTYGFPGSDNILFSKHMSSTPLFSIGRVTVKSNQDVLNYLDKVKSAESFENAPQTIDEKQWAKRIIHLGGGKDTDLALIRSHLEGMEKRITESKMGAKVFPFYKTSTDPIQNSRSKAIQLLVNGGVGVINFFGHSSASSFDFNIENPKEYSNEGRYFLMISNGCFSGRCHTSSASIGELFILEKDKGAVAYYASTGLGGINAMKDFTGALYDRLGDSEYGIGLGDVFSDLVGEIDKGYNSFSLDNILSQQQTLQGDPALRLYPAEGPDFVVNIENTTHTPNLLNTQIDSFELEVPVSNLGYKVSDNIVVSVIHENPKGEVIFTDSKDINSPGFETILKFDIPIQEEKDIVGLNTFYIVVDSTERVDELPLPIGEQNNVYSNGGELGYKILISSNDLKPIYPPEFAIVNDPELVLKASTSNPLIESQKFVFQIDTSQDFSSPLLLTETITQDGGVIKWKPTINLIDNTVYYWRTSQSDDITGSYRWESSSFLFDNGGKAGWNQSHYFQFLENDFDKTYFDNDRKLSYVNDFKDLVVTNGVAFFNPNDNTIWHNPAITINGNPQHGSISFREGDNGIRIYVLDSLSLIPRLVPSGFRAPSVAGRKFFAFETDTYDGRKAAISFLNDSIPKGNFVVFLTYSRDQNSDYRPDLWASDTDSLGTNLFDVLENKGALLARSLETSGPIPYAFAYKEGFPGLISDSEFVIQDSTLRIDKSIPLFTAWEEGSVYSPPIGPVKNWNEFSWKNDNDGVEINFANIYGIEKTGLKRLLKTELPSGSHNLGDIDSDEYPYLQLQFFSSDSASRTAPNLEYWRITHDETPEIAVNPMINFATSGDTIRVGSNYDFSIGLENISNTAMDSLLLRFTLRDNKNNITLTEKRIQPIGAGESANAEISVKSDQLSGVQSLVMEANPDDDQLELTHANNTAAVNFFVDGDGKNPLLDVTFDGLRITNGDIVSSEPFIEIVLKDENEFQLIEDTTSFKLFVKKPGTDISEEIYFDANPEITFIPATTGAQNTARIEYRPQFDVDGIYQLQVRGSDATGNLSGRDYLVNFKIINKSMISNILNYPNPFNNRTRFVYTLTGSEAPAFFKVQILTVSGKIVRELTQNDLGTLKIGTHQTENFWDGTDEYGDPLANGVYLYRMTAQKNDQSEIERFEEEDIDSFFKRGFGKMVILR